MNIPKPVTREDEYQVIIIGLLERIAKALEKKPTPKKGA